MDSVTRFCMAQREIGLATRQTALIGQRLSPVWLDVFTLARNVHGKLLKAVRSQDGRFGQKATIWNEPIHR